MHPKLALKKQLEAAAAQTAEIENLANRVEELEQKIDTLITRLEAESSDPVRGLGQ